MLKVILNSIILFSIVYSQSLEITAPNGNETIYNNDDYTIQWITSGNISPVDLSWSDDGGATFTAFLFQIQIHIREFQKIKIYYYFLLRSFLKYL